MNKPDLGFDVDRYRKFLAEAVDEKKRLALIDLLIEEKAKERLEAERASDRAAMTATTITNNSQVLTGGFRASAVIHTGTSTIPASASG
jgi:hypothetical protein